MTTREQQVLTSLGVTSETPGEHNILSLYVPRPAIEVGGEKWRILRKNVVDTLEERGFSAAARRVDAIELTDFQGLGFALFAKGDRIQTAHLSHAPVLSVTTADVPYLLPLFVDLNARRTDWIVVINREKPELYCRVGTETTDFTDRLDAPAHADIQERREVQDDLLFHSTSRGPSANVAFHALGTDPREEEEKTDDSYFREAWAAIDDVIPHQVERLVIVGAEGTVGRFIKQATTDRFELDAVRSGDGLDAVPTRAPSWPQDRQVLAAAMSEAREVCATGQVQELIVDLSKLPTVVQSSTSGDETFNVEEPPADELVELNGLVIAAAQMGATFRFFHKTQAPLDDRAVGMVMRW